MGQVDITLYEKQEREDGSVVQPIEFRSDEQRSTVALQKQAWEVLLDMSNDVVADWESQ